MRSACRHPSPTRFAAVLDGRVGNVTPTVSAWPPSRPGLVSIFASMLYVAADVESVRQLWSRSGALAGLDIRSQLEAYAEALNAAVAAQDPGAAVLVKNWWNAEVDGPLPSRIGERAAALIAARDHGFHAWSSVGGRCDERFELAVDAVIEGRIGDLTELLAADASLVAQRSRYGHCATLLHYTAANGVEIRRQVVPENAAAVAATLIAAGADPSAHFSAYGASVDVLQMLRSSAHPRAAGVAGALERELTRS